MRGDLEYGYETFVAPDDIIDYFNDADNDDKEIVSITYRGVNSGYKKPYTAFYKIQH